MAASVHETVPLRAETVAVRLVARRGRLEDGQSVHVEAEGDHRASAAPQLSHDGGQAVRHPGDPFGIAASRDSRRLRLLDGRGGGRRDDGSTVHRLGADLHVEADPGEVAGHLRRGAVFQERDFGKTVEVATNLYGIEPAAARELRETHPAGTP